MEEKDKVLTLKLYFQTLGNIQDGYGVPGDREQLERLKRELERDKILEPYYEFIEPSKVKKRRR